MSRIIAAVAVAIIAIVGVQAIGLQYEDAGRDVVVENETWTPDTGNVTQLDESELSRAFYDRNVTVQHGNGTELDAGVDYEWLQENGTIRALSGGALENTGNATIDYGYNRATQGQESWLNIMGQLTQWLGPATMIGILILLLVVLRGVMG